MPPKKVAKLPVRNAKPTPAATAASTRPKRTLAAAADEEPAPKKARTGRNATAAPKPAQATTTTKAKQSKTVTPANTSKPRGRPPKLPKEDPVTEDDEDQGDSSTAKKPTPKKRGRPSKSAVPTQTPSKPAAKPSGESSKAGASVKSKSKSEENDRPAPSRGRGRPSTKSAQASAETANTKSGQKKRSAATMNQDEADTNGQAEAAEAAPKRQRGRPSKSAVSDNTNVEVTVEGPSYWLMKAEPQSRFEKGVDVKFSIDDLKAAKEPEPWNGVRNHVAKNNMKAMKKGENAFFYHSNCKTPGIVGVMEIVEEASPDESAFDEKDPYYDAKAKRDNPNGWVIVRVKFRQKFDHPITLEQLKNLAKESKEIEDMQLLKQSRLSVSKVSPEEWDFIIKQVGINDNDAKLIEGQLGVSGVSTNSTPQKLAPPSEEKKPEGRATSVPAPSKVNLAPPKRGNSRASSRARSVPPNGLTAETGPAGVPKETPIAQAMARVTEEQEA